MPKQLKAAMLAAVLLVLFLSAQGTVASWRAEGTIKPTPISTGEMKLLAGDGTVATTSYQLPQMDSTTLIPGSFVQTPLTLSVSGSTGLNYGLSSVSSAPDTPTSADTALSSSVILSIYAGMSKESCSAKQNLTGEKLYQGPANESASFPAVRALEVTAGGPSSEDLCLRLSVPSDTAQSAAGGRIKLVLTFVGQQK